MRLFFVSKIVPMGFRGHEINQNCPILYSKKFQRWLSYSYHTGIPSPIDLISREKKLLSAAWISKRGITFGNNSPKRNVTQRSIDRKFKIDAFRNKGRNRKFENWTVPNIITTGRLCFVPVLGYWIVNGEYKLALGGLAVASISDWLDGYLARKLKEKTVLGGILDPLADKVMVATVSLSLGVKGLLPIPLVGLMFARDFLLVGGSIIHRFRTLRNDEKFFDVENLDWEVKPSFISKANTSLQFITLWVGLANGALNWPGEVPLKYLCYATGAATFASGGYYFVNSGIVARGKGRLATRIRIGRDKVVRQKEVVRTKMKEKRDRFAKRSKRVRESVEKMVNSKKTH